MANNVDLFNTNIKDNSSKDGIVLPIVLGAASIIGSIFSSKMQNEANEEMMDKQNEFNERLMDKQNEYNSPLNQKRLYNAAGISPAFLFGGQSGLDSSSDGSSSSGLANMVAPNLDMSTPAEMLFKSKELQNQTMQAEADIDKKQNESEALKIANSYAKERNRAEIDSIKSQKGLSDADRELRIAQKETELQRKEEVFRSAENLRYNAELLFQRAETENWNTERTKAEYEKLIKFLPIEEEALKAKYNLDNAQASLARKSLEDIDSQIKKRVKEGDLIDANVVGTIIDNVVKDAKSNPEIIEAMIRADNPIEFILLEHTNGMMQNLTGALATSGMRFDDNYNNFVDYKQRAREYKYNRSTPTSTYLFAK